MGRLFNNIRIIAQGEKERHNTPNVGKDIKYQQCKRPPKNPGFQRQVDTPPSDSDLQKRTEEQDDVLESPSFKRFFDSANIMLSNLREAVKVEIESLKEDLKVEIKSLKEDLEVSIYKKLSKDFEQHFVKKELSQPEKAHSEECSNPENQNQDPNQSIQNREE